ncbi:MAG TPA: alpha/beta hydrolase [Burkholderiales bacterium]|nr:alpha/beta hydrolase [Burkholderiales bacterium]
MRRFLAQVLVLGGMLAFAPDPVHAQGKDPNDALANELIVAQLPGRSVTAMITHQPGASKFTHAVAIFPGSPGYINLRMEGGEIQNDQRGGFLIRTRRLFLQDGYLTVVIDAPSDQQPNFPPEFRESRRYGEDIKAVVEAVSKKYGSLDWTFAGHSEGSISAAHAARMLPGEVKRVVLTASVVNPNPRGRGLSASEVAQIKVPVLWVHHRNDPCQYTQYRTVRSYAQETKTPLLTVTGASGHKGKACMAFTEHGFVGMEGKTVRAILSWINTGQVPPDVSE